MLTAAFVLFTVAWAADDKAEDPTKADLEKLQGTWEIVSGMKNGRPAPPEVVKSVVVLKGNSFAIKNDKDEVQRQTVFRLDAAKSPKRMDFIDAAGNIDSPGIYQLDGDNLKICVRDFGEEPPVSFNAKSGTDCTLIVLKRKK